MQFARGAALNYGEQKTNSISTTISLSIKIFTWAQGKYSRGAVKIYTLLDLRGRAILEHTIENRDVTGVKKPPPPFQSKFLRRELILVKVLQHHDRGNSPAVL